MSNVSDTSMDAFFHSHRQQPCIKALLSLRQGDGENADLSDGLAIYEDAIAFIERQLWTDKGAESALSAYQQCFRWMEQALALRGEDKRHAFIVVIPVADRPRQLASCLNSLLRLCEGYGYGGMRGRHWVKITVLIADDSKQEDNIQRHRALSAQFDQAGLRCVYFGQEEQRRLGHELAQRCPGEAERLLGVKIEADFRHKGASAMRNIAYLKLRELSENKSGVLFFFIDSDQAFAINDASLGGCEERQALNYFYYLDKVFSETRAQVLTGKVVGDPPVSPAVMAGNFIADVLAFLKQIARCDPQAPCAFHARVDQATDEAAYHDMADLFGFKPASEAFVYSCGLSGEHEHIHCFKAFIGKLKRFFDGEHPTRRTLFQYEHVLASIRPARTIYTGNYVLNREALAYFIPFAGLKLRMAGPVLGRLIKARIGERFISANLPLLHKRTEPAAGGAEFRPGVQRRSQAIDLSGEFERQFFGDVMLFAMEKLTERGFPLEPVSRQDIAKTVAELACDMQGYYRQKQLNNTQRLQQLKEIAADNAYWFNRLPDLREARRDMARFIDNIERNFAADAPVYRLIEEGRNHQDRIADMVEAIANFQQDQAVWTSVLNN